MEKKYTQGEWYVERTSSPEGDFQARILCNTRQTEYIAGQPRQKVYIIAGEPSCRNGQSNIHHEANAKLIAAAPEMLEVLETIENDNNQVPEWLWTRIQEVIKKATE
ncbi:hypothetical protein [Gaoshiqia sediminis]|uniref:Uncharacterized protein n=1 Tax=Gaoshiqia sediminis TaxID=2986998 RepID=A0AA42CAW4_9BACT|nr:hypothetical protein [Gaoshiqia sediminis]MCW0484100.1 hypothetical protein [Gaoshiqia sediminis]